MERKKKLSLKIPLSSDSNQRTTHDRDTEKEKHPIIINGNKIYR